MYLGGFLVNDTKDTKRQNCQTTRLTPITNLFRVKSDIAPQLFPRHPSALLCLPFFSFAVYEVSFISVGYFGKILLILQKRVRWLEESADG